MPYERRNQYNQWWTQQTQSHKALTNILNHLLGVTVVRSKRSGSSRRSNLMRPCASGMAYLIILDFRYLLLVHGTLIFDVWNYSNLRINNYLFPSQSLLVYWQFQDDHVGLRVHPGIKVPTLYCNECEASIAILTSSHITWKGPLIPQGYLYFTRWMVGSGNQDSFMERDKREWIYLTRKLRRNRRVEVHMMKFPAASRLVVYLTV